MESTGKHPASLVLEDLTAAREEVHLTGEALAAPPTPPAPTESQPYDRQAGESAHDYDRRLREAAARQEISAGPGGRFIAEAVRTGQYQPEAAAAQPAPARQPAAPRERPPAQRHTVVVLVGGRNMDLDDTYDAFGLLRGALRAQGIGEGDVFLYSYRGGDARGDTWYWTPYAKPDVMQSIERSTGHLQDLLRWLKIRGNRVAVVGYSLGGYVSLDALYRGDTAALPDVVVTVSSPLQGIDYGALQGACNNLRNTAIGGAIGGALLGLFDGGTALGLAAAAALAREAVCYSGPAAGELDAVYRDANWRAARDDTIARTLRARNIRLMTIGARNDCLYAIYICSDYLAAYGGDLTRTALSRAADVATLYPVSWSACAIGFACIDDSHRAILNDPGVMREIAGFMRR